MVEVDYPQLEGASGAVEWFKTWRRVRDEKELVIRARTRPGSASPVVLLASGYSDRRERGLATRVKINGSWDNFESTVAEDQPGVSGSLKSAERRAICTHPHNLRMARHAEEFVGDALAARTPPVASSLVRMTRFVFEELGVNVVQHSGKPSTGVGWADLDESSTRFELAFADCGVGFRASLQQNPELSGRIADDAEALQSALTARVSSSTSTRKKKGWPTTSAPRSASHIRSKLLPHKGTSTRKPEYGAAGATPGLLNDPNQSGAWATKLGLASSR
jgi:hypothetical protein